MCSEYMDMDLDLDLDVEMEIRAVTHLMMLWEGGLTTLDRRVELHSFRQRRLAVVPELDPLCILSSRLLDHILLLCRRPLIKLPSAKVNIRTPIVLCLPKMKGRISYDIPFAATRISQIASSLSQPTPIHILLPPPLLLAKLLVLHLCGFRPSYRQLRH